LEVWEAIQGRRSIRAFKLDPIPEELLRNLIVRAAIWAPTGGNAQTWRFAVVTDPDLIRKVRMVSPGLLSTPPAVIAVCQNLDEVKKRGGELGTTTLAFMDSAMAAQNIMLAAYAEGLGTCAIASFHAGAIRQILRLPAAILPQLLISLGYPAIRARAPTRNAEVMWFNEHHQE
jgi:nitroreductase